MSEDEVDSDTGGESDENGGDFSKEFDPNESENDGEQEEFDPNDSDGEIEPEQFDPNESENDEEQEEFNPNDPDGDAPEQFDPNESENDGEQEEFDPNDPDREIDPETETDSNNYDPDDYGTSLEHEQYSGEHENFSAQAMSTVLINENLIYAYLKSAIENQNEVEQREQTEIDDSKEQVSELEEFLNQERERIQLEQEQQQKELDETIESEPDLEPVANEEIEEDLKAEEKGEEGEEGEQEQGEEDETQESISEEFNNEEEVENREMEPEEELQAALPNESIELDSKERLDELKLDDEENEKDEQRQSETTVENRHENDLQLIREKHEEIEEEEEFKQEIIDPQQELEEILEQNRKIEQEALDLVELELIKEEQEEKEEEEEFEQEIKEKQDDVIEKGALESVEQEEESLDYEEAKKLYRQETGGKMPIYAKKETKGFKLWLELKKEGKKHVIDQENLETGELLENWLNEEHKEEISPDIKEIVENYEELQKLTSKFMGLYKKEQLPQAEKKEFKTTILKLEKIGYNKVVLFSNLRALNRYLSNKRVVNKTLNKLIPKLTKNYNKLKESAESITFEEIPPSSLFFSLLSSSQIKALEQKYEKMLKKICEKYAVKLKDILIEEYGYKILGLKKPLPLGSHFGFKLTKYTGKVTASYVRRAVSVEFLERVKQHIIQKYGELKSKTEENETSFKKVISFINQYQEFSEHVSKRFAISRIKYQEGSEKLETKSWLIENLRYMFPKKFGLPLSDNLLSWFIFGDVPVYRMPSKLVKHTSTDEVFRKMPLTDLLAMNYRVTKLTVEGFGDKGIKITEDDLETLKKSVSFLVYYYVFGGYGDSAQVSATKRRGAEVGKAFFTIEYEVIRAIFFAAAEANKGEPLGIRALSKAMGIPDISVHLRRGRGLGESLEKMQNYFKKLSKNSDSSSKILQNAKEVLDGYNNAYRVRRNKFKKSQKSKSMFQGRMHKSLEAFFGLTLRPEEQLRALLNEKYITAVNNKGVKEKIYVHPSFAFDMYLELNKTLKNYLGLDDKWIGLAIEAMGTYYHSNAAQKEADRKKRLICKKKNIILAEIWEDLEPTAWQNEVIKEIKDKTGVNIPRKKLSELSKYLGKK